MPTPRLNGDIAATRCGHDFFGTPHCLFATDAPFDAERGRALIAGTIAAVKALEISAAEQARVLRGQRARPCEAAMIETRNIKVKLRDGDHGRVISPCPSSRPAPGIVAIMEIWGVNDTMRHHAREFAEAGFACLVPDLFWRQEPGVELSDANPAHIEQAFDLYYEFDYDLGVRDMEDTVAYLAALQECTGKVGAVGYCLGGKLCYLLCCRTDIDCAVAYYGTYIEHNIREVGHLHRPFMLHMAMKDRWVQAEVNAMLERRLAPNPLVDHPQISRGRPRLRPQRRQDLPKAEADRALGLTLEFFRKHLAGWYAPSFVMAGLVPRLSGTFCA